MFFSQQGYIMSPINGNKTSSVFTARLDMFNQASIESKTAIEV